MNLSPQHPLEGEMTRHLEPTRAAQQPRVLSLEVPMQNIRRTITLLLALIGFLGFAQAGKLPADPRFDAPVKVDVPAGGISLEMYLKAIGYAVKLNVVADSIPTDKKINVDFNGKAFRRVWETITTLNDLDFELMPEDIMIVGPSTIVSRFRQSAPTTASGEPKQTYTYIVKSDPTGIQGLLAKQFPEASINNVANTRILVINATASQYAKMSELLNNVDLAPATVITPQAVRRIFKLSNAKASDLAKTIQGAISGPTVTEPNAQGNTTVTQTALPNAPVIPAAPTIIADVKTTVVADESSNTLIISGLPEAVEELGKLIPQLDTRQSMVNVNVRIQEVTNDAALSLGIEWSFGVGNFSGKLLESGVKFLFDSTSALAGFNIGAALNALESQKLSKRINDSNVSVVNNGSASIRSGGRIELNIASAAGNISKTIPFGVQLQVKPRISNDGSIAMDIAAEVSDVQNKGSLDPNRIDFDERKSETTVLMQSGQTVLLGSLLATTQDESNVGIPLLSAIPLIGDLFKTRKTNDRQTQLLIVVTANIIK
jgi:type II secretory pathway component GspD/PulD (secretin)